MTGLPPPPDGAVLLPEAPVIVTSVELTGPMLACPSESSTIENVVPAFTELPARIGTTI